MTTRLYQSINNGDIIEADQVADGHHQTVKTYEGEEARAEGGDFIIFSPWVEVVDEESFHLEYIEL